jgi:hypothetical protein
LGGGPHEGLDEKFEASVTAAQYFRRLIDHLVDAR